jgi:hypothetical protein
MTEILVSSIGGLCVVLSTVVPILLSNKKHGDRQTIEYLHVQKNLQEINETLLTMHEDHVILRTKFEEHAVTH